MVRVKLKLFNHNRESNQTRGHAHPAEGIQHISAKAKANASCSCSFMLFMREFSQRGHISSQSEQGLMNNVDLMLITSKSGWNHTDQKTLNIYKVGQEEPKFHLFKMEHNKEEL